MTPGELHDNGMGTRFNVLINGNAKRDGTQQQRRSAELNKVCTLDESVRRESRIEGKEEQRREDVISLLEAGLAVEVIAKALKTSIENIEKIKQSRLPNKRFA